MKPNIEVKLHPTNRKRRKICFGCYQKKWVAKNRGRVRRYRRTYARTHKKEMVGYQKAYRVRHEVRLKKKRSKWLKKNKRRLYDKWNAWAKTPQGRKVRHALTAKRWAAIRGTGRGTLKLVQWEKIKARYWFRCAYCGKKRRLTMDHVTPLTLGGLHVAKNIVPACQSCNSRKRNKIWLPRSPREIQCLFCTR